MNIRLRVPQDEDDREQLTEMVYKAGTEGGIDPYANPADMMFWLLEGESARGDTTGRPYWDVVGYTGISNVDNVARRCRGFIWVDPTYRGNGVATEALKKRNDMLFDQLNMHRVEWVVPADNEARLHIAEKLGQTQEGILREAVYYDGAYHDLVCFAALRSDREK